MRARGMTLQEMVPLADPQDAAAEHIRHALRDPRAEIRAACLIGMGHWQLGADLFNAASALHVARQRQADLERRPMTEHEAAESPLLAVVGTTYVDPDAGEAAEWAVIKAQNEVTALEDEAQEIADRLDHGYDGALS